MLHVFLPIIQPLAVNIHLYVGHFLQLVAFSLFFYGVILIENHSHARFTAHVAPLLSWKVYLHGGGAVDDDTTDS